MSDYGASGISLVVMTFVCLIVMHQVSPSPYDICVSDCGALGISLAVMTFVCLVVVHQVSPSPL